MSELIGVAISPEYLHAEGKLHLVGVVNLANFRIELRGLDPESGRFLPPERIAGNGLVTVPRRTTHVCFAGDRHDGSLYLFAGGAMANLTAGKGDSLNSFDLTVALLAAGVGYMVKNGEREPPGIHLLPPQVCNSFLQ